MPLARSRALAALAGAGALGPMAVRAQAAGTVRVGIPVTEGGVPVIYALRTGMFARAGLTVELTRMASGAAIAAAIAGGNIDTGSTNMVSLVIAHAKGIPFVINAASGNIWLPSSSAGCSCVPIPGCAPPPTSSARRSPAPRSTTSTRSR